MKGRCLLLIQEISAAHVERAGTTMLRSSIYPSSELNKLDVLQKQQNENHL